jgi:hypothetical protein
MTKATIEKKFSYSLATKPWYCLDAYPVDGTTAVNKTAQKQHVDTAAPNRYMEKNFAKVWVVIDDNLRDTEHSTILQRRYTNRKSHKSGGGRKDGFTNETIQKFKDNYECDKNVHLSNTPVLQFQCVLYHQKKLYYASHHCY